MAVLPLSEGKREMMEHCMIRFREEAQLLQSLHEIESVVNIYDFFYANGTCYFVMEYLDGVNLRTAMENQGGRLDQNTVMQIAENVGMALVEIHKKGIYHRDIAPDNIFILNGQNKIKLLDFGNAKHLMKQEGEFKSVVLKMGYSPPEQYSQKSMQGTFTDVYAFAFTLYYAMTGIKPPAAFDRQSTEYTKLSELGFSMELSEVFDRALRLNSRERTQTVSQFLTELRMAMRMQRTPNRPVENMANPGFQYIQKVEVVSGENRQPNTVTILQPDQAMTMRKTFHPILEVFIDDKFRGKYKIQPDKHITIGRNRNVVGFPVSEKHVSAHHCDLFYKSDERVFYVRDLSTNGTSVNDVAIGKGGVVQARSGAKISLGSGKAVILLSEE
jgi:serine/threonine protein kinase